MHPISPFAPSLASTLRLEDRSHALLILVFFERRQARRAEAAAKQDCRKVDAGFPLKSCEI
jgi:hypothetical protein